MKKKFWPKSKILALAAILVIYICLGTAFKFALNKGWVEKAPPSPPYMAGADEIINVEQSILPNLESAQYFFENNFVRNKGHINLYIAAGRNKNLSDMATNSEAVSYYMLSAANEQNKKKFDAVLDFMESRMIHPNFDYMMWRLDYNDSVSGDGSNIATDADLRAIKAL